MKKRITITVDDDVIKLAKIKAIRNDSTLSATIEFLLRQYINSSSDNKETHDEDD